MTFSQRRDGSRLRTPKGFTLIEVLIVLVIVAIITAVAAMAFGHFGRGRREKMIAEQFIQTISVAQQQAILTPTVIGLGINNAGYRYYEYTRSLTSKKARWELASRGSLSHPNAFRRAFEVNVKDLAAFDDGATSDAAQPSILFLPSGYVTPFVLDLKGGSHHFVITVENNGAVKVRS